MTTLTLVAVASAASMTAPAATRLAAQGTLDETLQCATVLVGGLHGLTIQAHAATGRRGSQWYRPAQASVGTSGAATAADALDSWLAWVTAGSPTRDSTVIPDPYTGYSYPFRTWGTLAWHTERCTRSRQPVPLSGAGLTKRAVGGIGVRFACDGAPKKVLVRLRGTLLGNATPTAYRQFLRVTAPLSRGQMAVRTLAGKPLAYADVLASGKVELSTARVCASE